MANRKDILVLGARGNVGSAVLASLRRAGRATCDGEVYAGISARGEAVPPGPLRCANLDHTEQLLAAMEGVDRAFVMVPFGDRMSERMQRVIDCARDAGLAFVVRLSGLAAAEDGPSAMARCQGHLDRMLRDSGIDHCILRCNSFMQNFTGMYCPMLRRGRLSLAQGEGRISFVDTADIGEAAARILCAPDQFSASVLDINGPEALTNRGIAAQIAKVSGRDIEYRPLTEERAREGYRRAGLPEWEVELFSELDRFLGGGGAALSGAPLARVLGRTPTPFAEFAQRHRGCWI